MLLLRSIDDLLSLEFFLVISLLSFCFLVRSYIHLGPEKVGRFEDFFSVEKCFYQRNIIYIRKVLLLSMKCEIFIKKFREVAWSVAVSIQRFCVCGNHHIFAVFHLNQKKKSSS